MTNARADAGQGTGDSDIGPIVFDASGLVPLVAQDEATGDVLLLAYMNEDALRRTLAEGVLVLWSRSRGRLWRKGEQSGHTLRLRELRVNCEGNSLLARVRLEGPGSCHEGYRSCYFRRVETDVDGALTAAVVDARVFDPAAVYGNLSPDSYGHPPEAPAQRRGWDVGEGEHAEEFERAARELYAAYEWLRDEDHTVTSRTARLLREPVREATARHAAQRGLEELGELTGVVAGTHRHRGGDTDVILEAGQVAYWAMVAAVALGHPYDAWRPHALWLAGWSGWNDADVELPSQDTGLLYNCASLILAAGNKCREAGVHPARVVAADLVQMQAKHPIGGVNRGTVS